MSGVSSISSLLNFLDAPIVVGDPEGGVIFVNPAFERAFSKPAVEACGESLAALFGGGGREAILSAVAAVCTRGESVRFRLREAGGAYLGLCSPIETEEDRVGVVILLTDEPAADERLLAFQGEIAEPLDEAAQAFEEILEQTGGRRSERHRGQVERGIAAIERARKWSDQLHGALVGRSGAAAQSASLDPVKVARQVVGRLAGELRSSDVTLQLLVPAQLRSGRGDPAMLESALTRLLRHRLAAAAAGDFVTLSVRAIGDGDDAGLIFSVVDHPAGEPEEGVVESEPRAVRAGVAALGGQICSVQDPSAGRVTAIRLALAPKS